MQQWNPVNWKNHLCEIHLVTTILDTFLCNIALSYLSIFLMKMYFIVKYYLVLLHLYFSVAASICLGLVSVVFLKLVSYHMVNYWCRLNSVSAPKVRRRSASSDRSRRKSKKYFFLLPK